MADETGKEKLNELQEKFNKLQSEQVENTKTIASYQRQIKEDWDGIMTAAEEEELIAARKAQIKQRDLERLLNELEAKKLIKTLSEDELKVHEDIVKEIKEKIELLDEEIDKADELKEAYNDISSSSNYILEKFTGINGKSKKFADAMKQSGGAGAYLKKTIGGVANQMTLANVGATLLLKTFEKIASYAQTAKKLTIDPVSDALDVNKATELAFKRLDEFRASARELQLIDPGEIEAFEKRMFHLSDTFKGTTEDFIKINKALHQTSNVFRELELTSPAAANAMIGFANVMERSFKVPAQDTANLMDHVSHTFGLGATEAQQFTAEMSVLADNLGLNVTQTLKDFESHSSNLSKFGLPSMRNEFMKLSKVSQLTGIGIGSIVGSLEGLSTFEGALTAASKINAVFGTTLDGLELAETVDMEGPVAAFIKLKEGLGGIDISSIKSRSRLTVLAQSIGMTAEELIKMDQVGVESLQNIAGESMTVVGAMEKVNSMSERSDLTTEGLARTQDEAAKNMHSTSRMLEDQTRAMTTFAEENTKLAQTINELSGMLKILAGVAIVGVIGKMVAATSAGGKMMGMMGNMGGAVPGLVGKLAKLSGGLMGVAMAGQGGKALQEAGHETAGAATAVLGGAASGAMMGSAILPGWGTAIGGVLGGIGGAMQLMAPGNNFVSTTAPMGVGEAGTETYAERTQITAKAGSKLTKEGGSSTPISLNLTVNLVTKEGKTLSSQTTTQNFAQDAGADFGKHVNAYLDKHLNLIYD